MAAYYNRRYDGRYWREVHASKRKKLTSLFGGIDHDIEGIFLTFKSESLEHIFNKYGSQHGYSAESYARKTYKKWKRGSVTMSGQTAERLLNLLPPYLSQNQRYDLIKKLRRHYLKKSYENVITPPESWRKDVMPALERILNNTNNFKLPDELYQKATWLSDGDVESVHKILSSIELEEANLRTFYLEVEFKRIESLINSLENTESASHKIILPQGEISVTIRQEKESFLNKFMWRRNMNKKNNDLVPKEELERALVQQQQRGSLLNLTLNDLTESQRIALREKIINEKIDIDASQMKADNRLKNSTRDMQNTVNIVSSLEQSSKSDYSVKSSFDTASGTTDIHVKKNNNTVIIVVAVVIGIIIYILTTR